MRIGSFIMASLLIYACCGQGRALTQHPTLLFVMLVIFFACMAIILIERAKKKDDKTGTCIFIIGVEAYIFILMLIATFTWPLVDELLLS